MSIERNHARRDSEAVAQRQLDAKQADRHVREAKHDQPMAERVDRFAAAMQKQGEPKKEPTTAADQRALMQQQGQKTKSAEQSKLAAEQAAREQEGGGQQASTKSLDERTTQRKHDSNDASSHSESRTDAATLWQSQMALRNDATQMPAAPAPVNTQMFSELIQKHVRQMAASDSAGKGNDGQVLLRMSDATLPGTDLLLSRTETGWTLRADSRSRDSYDAIRRAAPDLAQRFADGELGELTVEPYFHG